MKCLQTGSRLTECVETMVHMDVKHFHKCVKISCRVLGASCKGLIMQCGFGVCYLASLLHMACSCLARVVLTKHGNEVCVCDDTRPSDARCVSVAHTRRVNDAFIARLQAVLMQ